MEKCQFQHAEQSSINSVNHVTDMQQNEGTITYFQKFKEAM